MTLEKRNDRDAARRQYEAVLKLDPAQKGTKDGLARLEPAKQDGPDAERPRSGEPLRGRSDRW